MVRPRVREGDKPLLRVFLAHIEKFSHVCSRLVLCVNACIIIMVAPFVVRVNAGSDAGHVTNKTSQITIVGCSEMCERRVQ